MPGAYNHRYDSQAEVWKRDLHRADIHPWGLQSGVGTLTILNNGFDYDFLVTSLFLYVYATDASVKQAFMVITTAADVVHSYMAAVGVLGPNCATVTRTFPMPHRVWATAKVKIIGPTDAFVTGCIDGAWDMPP